MIVPHETLIIENHELSWFIERIGQRVFRTENGCGCDTCKNVERFGTVIKNQEHAMHLLTVQNEMGLNYYQK